MDNSYMIKYLELATDVELNKTVDDINSLYIADMQARLGRAANETIDSIIDRETGNIIGPADSVITTQLVEPVTSKTEAGGLVFVDTSVEKYLSPDEMLATTTKEELSAKWQSELDSKELDSILVQPIKTP